MKKITEHHCLNCNYSIYDSVADFSQNRLGFKLCKKCQQWLKENDSFVTSESKLLYLALRARGINANLEKFDGHKHIDIAITQEGSCLNIEIDGSHHYTDAVQSYADFQRTHYSLLKGFVTLRLPNILVRERQNEVADSITELLEHRRKEYALLQSERKKRKVLEEQLQSVSLALKRLSEQLATVK